MSRTHAKCDRGRSQVKKQSSVFLRYSREGVKYAQQKKSAMSTQMSGCGALNVQITKFGHEFEVEMYRFAGRFCADVEFLCRV